MAAKIQAHRPPVIWSIAGLDTAGGAGLSADQRAADAMGVHLCPVAAALTAQHSQGVQGVFPVDPAILQAQLQALAGDLPPRAIKTGLLGSVAAIETVAHWVDHWRAQTPTGVDPHRHLALIVDPVLGATAGGAAFSNDAIVQAYRTLLLPRATVLTPNRAEATRLLGQPADHGVAPDHVPALAAELKALDVRSVVITGGDAPTSSPPSNSPDTTEPAPHCLDWLDTPHAQGWLTAPRVDTPHSHGTGCTFASGIASALALGHVEADAIVLARMLTHHALMHGHAAGAGAGPVQARSGFTAREEDGGAPLPWLGLGTALPWRLRHPSPTVFQPYAPPADRLYGILATSEQVEAAIQAGLQCVQLRHKAPAGLMPHLHHSLRTAAAAGVTLFINDHWRQALAHQAEILVDAPRHPAFRLGLHLGQEDLQALSDDDQAALLAQRQHLTLGLSSHSLWELARAAGCGASMIACGPVQATTTKDMPWLPQGADNLRWWVDHSPVPVVAIGGLLTADDIARFALCGPAAMCVVRGLGTTLSTMQQVLPSLRAATRTMHRATHDATPVGRPSLASVLPHPVLPPGV